jgi:hypothetical protein
MPADSVVSPDWVVTPPLLFNLWKHHAGFLRAQVRSAAGGGTPLQSIASQLVVIGTDLMDLYCGPLTPAAIAGGIISHLQMNQLFERSVYQNWIESGGRYRVVEVSDDSSRWVLRLGEHESRYVHVHPGRKTPHTCRVRANVLKTAVMGLSFAAVHGGDSSDIALLNRVRREYLHLPPIGRQLTETEGIGAVLALLGGES